MADILGQLFGQPQQTQDPQGLVQSILSQRFQPSDQDVNQATAMSGIQRNYVSPYAVEQQRIAPGMDVASKLAAIQQQGAQTQGLNLQNQMTEFQMPFLQNMYKQMYGGQGGEQPVGFPQGRVDPRLAEARMAGMMGNKGLSEADMAIYNADPTVISQKSEAGKAGETSAEAGKTLNVMSANLPVVMQRLKEMEDAVPQADYGVGTNNEGEGLQQQIADTFKTKSSVANQLLLQRAAQGVLPELGPQLAQAGIRGNKFLETLASSASGLRMSASPEAKLSAIQGLREQYISNLKSTARQVRAQGGQAPSDAEIDQITAQFMKNTGNTTGAMNTPSKQTKNESGNQPESMPQPGEVRYGHRFKGGDPNDQNSWEQLQ